MNNRKCSEVKESNTKIYINNRLKYFIHFLAHPSPNQEKKIPKILVNEI